MTAEGQVPHRRRPGIGVLAAVMVLAVVALPGAYAGFVAVVSLTGCFLECGEPATAQGVLWASLALGLMTLPVVVGALVARVRLRRMWPWAAALTVTAMVAVGFLQRAV